jgi:nucleotide-binding universal stress UspA family protein
MTGTIVVGIGGDEREGSAAARCAADLAAPLGVPLVLVFGYEASPLAPRGGPLEEQIAEVGRRAADAVKAQLAASHPGMPVEVELVQQRPVDALLRVAEERDARLVAVGHGGAGPLRGALLGSIAYEIVHRSPRPVLVVPDDPDDG